MVVLTYTHLVVLLGRNHCTHEHCDMISGDLCPFHLAHSYHVGTVQHAAFVEDGYFPFDQRSSSLIIRECKSKPEGNTTSSPLS